MYKLKCILNAQELGMLSLDLCCLGSSLKLSGTAQGCGISGLTRDVWQCVYCYQILTHIGRPYFFYNKPNIASFNIT